MTRPTLLLSNVLVPPGCDARKHAPVRVDDLSQITYSQALAVAGEKA